MSKSLGAQNNKIFGMELVTMAAYFSVDMIRG